MHRSVYLTAIIGSILGILTGPTASVALAQEVQPPAAPAAPQRPSLLERAVNDPRVSSWSVYGPNQTARIIPSAVQGNNALRIDVTAAGANPWDVGANAVSSKPISAGDVILLGVWARAERLAEGASVARLNIGLQLNATPYTPMASRNIEVKPEWKLYFLQLDAPRDYEAGQAAAAVHLATASQVIDLGPVFILDFGQGYDKSTLPTD